MSLDYEFMPIDVTLMTHPKAFAAGVEAMGLWLFGCLLAKHQRTGGIVSRAAALGMLGGKTNAKLAKRLVEAGLWIEREDGDFEIWNHAKKAPKLGPDGRTSGARRTAKWRDGKRPSRDASHDPPASHVTVTPNVTRDVTRDVSASVSVSSGITSDLISADPDPDPTCQVDGPPEWWGAAAETAEMAVGVPIDALPARWLEYREARTRQGWAMSQGNAAAWLTTVVRRERRDASRRGPARADTRQPMSDPNPDWLRTGGSSL